MARKSRLRASEDERETPHPHSFRAFVPAPRRRGREGGRARRCKGARGRGAKGARAHGTLMRLVHSSAVRRGGTVLRCPTTVFPRRLLALEARGAALEGPLLARNARGRCSLALRGCPRSPTEPCGVYVESNSAEPKPAGARDPLRLRCWSRCCAQDLGACLALQFFAASQPPGSSSSRGKSLGLPEGEGGCPLHRGLSRGGVPSLRKSTKSARALYPVTRRKSPLASQKVSPPLCIPKRLPASFAFNGAFPFSEPAPPCLAPRD